MQDEKSRDKIPEELILKMKALIEIGRKEGRVLPVEEAFRRFPVEEEVHKGKIEYWQKGVV